MNSKKVYLIRHGQTDFNLKNIVQGSGVDTDLNEMGRKQACSFFAAYKDIPFDHIYTSTLKRSQQSVKQFFDLGIQHTALVGLNEISWGAKEGHRVTVEEDEYYHYMLNEWQKGNTTLRIQGGESPEDVIRRMKPAMDFIMRQDRERTILICMHGRAMRILLCHLLQYPLRCMDMFDHTNLCLYVLNFTGRMFHVERYNDTAHLALS
ncbi:MAG TPA: histidine phosphatase family protein [Chryseosolibacter sp.]|nr:histidine phosphatase family protein [Chryseosolibacter sp.]